MNSLVLLALLVTVIVTYFLSVISARLAKLNESVGDLRWHLQQLAKSQEQISEGLYQVVENTNALLGKRNAWQDGVINDVSDAS